jgi:glyoxylase-like metal-dependent hydrolase (beta-lactamase superfamily II)
MPQLRSFTAPNPSAMTLDGTRTFVIGHERVAVIDPGPAIDEHLDAVADAVGGADALILLTHRHPDHAEGAAPLAARLGGARVVAPGGDLMDGARFDTDDGTLVAIHTPGHTPDHFSFLHERTAAVFCGDLMAGGLDTTWVGTPEGDLDAYIASLDRLRGLEPRVIHPAHGPSIDDPAATIDAYLRHREARQRQVLAALRTGPADVYAIAERVYAGTIPPELRTYAASATEAYLLRLERLRHVERVGDTWRLAGAG